MTDGTGQRTLALSPLLRTSSGSDCLIASKQWLTAGMLPRLSPFFAIVVSRKEGLSVSELSRSILKMVLSDRLSRHEYSMLQARLRHM